MPRRLSNTLRVVCGRNTVSWAINMINNLSFHGDSGRNLKRVSDRRLSESLDGQLVLEHDAHEGCFRGEGACQSYFTLTGYCGGNGGREGGRRECTTYNRSSRSVFGSRRNGRNLVSDVSC